jgi:hypothetical protein
MQVSPGSHGEDRSYMDVAYPGCLGYIIRTLSSPTPDPTADSIKKVNTRLRLCRMQ